MNKLVLGTFIMGFLSSCSSFNKVAINTASGLLYQASGNVESEGNYELAKLGLPANLILLEGLLSESKNNDEILATLTKGYAGLAFGFNEADNLIDQWENKTDEANKNLAIMNYSKAINFGIRYLKQKKINWEDLKTKMNDQAALMHLFDKNLSSEKIDLETLMFTAQSLGSVINLQKDNMTLVSELPIVKAMFDWTCMKKPSLNFGTCDIFFGTYEAGRPKMLGGNPDKGKEIFEKAILKHPYNWLIRVSYIQYYLIPMADEEGFKIQMDYLKERAVEFKQSQMYQPTPQIFDWAREDRLRLFQSIAIKRYELFEKYKKQLF